MSELKERQGKFYTRQLLWEEWVNMEIVNRVIDPKFSLYSDKEGLINFGRAYVESEDPTGYTVANELLGGYRHWTILMQSPWFQTAKKIWDEELDARLVAKGLVRLKDLLENGAPAQQAVAAKYFADKEYRKDKTTSRGRPTKAQVSEEARKAAEINSQVADDLKRIKVVNL